MEGGRDEPATSPPASTLQLLVSLPWGGPRRTRVLSVPTSHEKRGLPRTAGALLAPLLEEVQGEVKRSLPPLVATYRGKRYQLQERLPVPVTPEACGFDTLHVSLAEGGLRGGKGGFGAMLRSMGKGAGVKKTTDFGACRDLYGRRLRHVNDEIRLKKWLEDKEREEESRDRKRGKEKAPEKTPSGIDGWYLSVPSWAELKPSNANAQRSANRKTALCKHWIEARENGRRPPPGAPLHWGCPSGTRCNFAHGDEELRGEGLEQLRALEKGMAERQREFEQERYLGAQALAPPVDVQSAVLEGLKAEARARKKGRTGPLELYEGEPEGSAQGEEKKKGAGPAVLPIEFGTGTVSWSTQSQCPWMEALSGSLSVGAQGTLSGGIVGEFATAIVPLRHNGAGAGAGASLGSGVVRGGWYYEVEAMSAEGSVQIGWATDHFEADANEGDGVGDDRNSWGFDPVHAKAWHNEEERSFGPSDKWEVGDVLGVLLELPPDDAALPDAPKKATKGGGGGNGGGRISYFLNGKPLGVAFEGLPSSLDAPPGGNADAQPPTLLRYYPALSLDEGEALRVNIGTRPFAFSECVPANAKPVAEAMAATTTAADDDEPQQSAAPAAVVGSPSAVVDKAPPQPPQQQKQAEDASNSISNSSGGNGNGGGGTSESKAPPPPKRDVAPEALDLGRFTAAEELEALGLDRLKAALMALGVKCGGTLQERAARLWSLKGVPAEEIDPKLRVKQKK